MNECEYCNGKGYNIILLNYSGFHYDAEEPVVDHEPCEECGVECE